MTGRLGDHALVIGASIAGLTSAAVLAGHFAAVTIVERDVLDGATRERRGVPQGHHLHTLLRGGQEALLAIYPALGERLRAAGAGRFRVGIEGVIHCPEGPFYNFGCTVARPFDFGTELYLQSRGLLEQCLRGLTLEHPNVRLESGAVVEAILGDARRVRGVRVRRDDAERRIDADLVVDAGGRASTTPRALEGFGLRAPAETVIEVDFAYASSRFRIPPDYAEPYRMMAFHGPAPRHAKAAALLAIEDGCWLVSLAGRFDEKPPTSADGFMRFVADLPTPKLHALLRNAERVAEIRGYRFPRSVRRHYERLASFPAGLLVVGDALASVNPVYGQGMSTAALEATLLRALLDARAQRRGGLAGLAGEFFARAAGVVATPWALAATADFAYPRTRGPRPRFMALRRRYAAALDELAAHDATVNHLLTEVFHLAKPLDALGAGALRNRALVQLVTAPLRRSGATRDA